MEEKALFCGHWITAGSARPFYARRRFFIPQAVKSARASVCGLGQFIFYMNGQKIGDHELDPGWTDYRQWIQYVTFDVAQALKAGENMMGAEVGNGWYIKMDDGYTFSFPDFMPPNPNLYRPFGRSLILAVKLELEFEDGSREVLWSDESFRVHAHPVTMTNVYGSETEDRRLRVKDWCLAESSDGGWEPARLLEPDEEPAGLPRPQLQPAVKVIRSYDGILSGRAGGREIYDFGQNMAGLLEFEAKGKAGDKLLIYPAEKLKADGDIDQTAKGWTDVASCMTYILGEDDAWETFRMKFTYFGGRYAAVEKLPAHTRDGGNEKIQIKNMKAHAISSAWKTDGAFFCDDGRYMQIYDMIEKTVEANLLSVHTDCPTIERFAWQEINHLMAPSIFYMKDGKGLWEKFLTDMRMAQHKRGDCFNDLSGGHYFPGEGLIPSQCPCYIPNVLPIPGMGSFYDTIAWGSACILGTRWHYLFYGDIQVIKDNYQTGLNYVRYLKTRVDENGFISHGLGDWGHPDGELARENIETAFLYADVCTLAWFAGLLGRIKEQRELERWASQIKENYNEKLLARHPSRDFWCYRVWEHKDRVFLTQAAQALPLYWGLVPDEKRADVERALIWTLENRGAFAAGEIGLPYIIQAASGCGQNYRIARYMLREKHPGYYAFVKDGMTTLGEYWEENPRSHCHDMMGHIIEWYYNGLAGIRPQKPGFAQVQICPYLPETMTALCCSYHCVRGRIEVRIRLLPDGIHLDITAPENMKLDICTDHLKERGTDNIYVSVRRE